MSTLETTQQVPLRSTEDGTILVADSRVSLDSVLHHYKLGASAEQIVQKFPSLELADVYASITYYLQHEESVEHYLREEERRGIEVQREIESAPDYEKRTAGLRQRLSARKSELK